MKAADAMAPPVTERSFDEYHLYSLARPVTLRDHETKQVEFVRAAGVESQKLYVYDGAQIVNQGSWEFTADGGVGWWNGAAPLFSNQGSVVADAGTSATGITTPFSNSGTVSVHGGTFTVACRQAPPRREEPTDLPRCF